jgi:hypothetical protein
VDIFERQPHDLHAWLRIATRGLAARAKERIRLEIEAHHAEAVSDHLSKGLSESEARSAALAELGDADRAAKSFRERHLTTREAEGLERTFKSLGSRWWLLFNYYLFLNFCACVFYAVKAHYRSVLVSLVPLAVVFIATVIIPTFTRRMVRSKPQNLCSSIPVAMVAFLLYALSYIYLLAGFSFFLVISVALTTSLIPVFRVWSRLRHVANILDELPLRNE